MPDFDEARWQDVEKKASDELDSIECQDLTAVPILRVPPAKSDMILLHFQQAAMNCEEHAKCRRIQYSL